jgi:hypothetical protein
LDHKPRQAAVDEGLVVSASVYVEQKVGNGERRLRIEQLYIDVADVAGKAHHAICEKAIP